MTTYTKTTDFAAKDALTTGNPAKLVKGTEIGAEFDNIATADATNAKIDTTNTFASAQTFSSTINKITLATSSTTAATLTVNSGSNVTLATSSTSAGTLSLTSGKTVTHSNTITMGGVDSSTLNVGSGNAANLTLATSSTSSATLTVNSGSNVTLATTSTSAGTLTLTSGKSPAITNTITLGGTDSTTMTFPASTTTVAGLGITQTFTAPQRGTRTTDNDASFDLSVTNLWKCTPTGAAALTFTNHADGQSGNILFINGSNYAITAAATTKVTSSFLTTISATGTYIINYTDDGTNTYCSCAGAMS